MGRIAQGWQVTLADLALILFITSVAGLVEARRQGGETAGMVLAGAAMSGGAVAIYRAGADTPDIEDWLDEQVPDPRQRLTIVARYREGGLEEAEREASRLAHLALAGGHNPRVIVEQGEESDLVAFFAYDAEEQMAQALQDANVEKGGNIAAR